MFSEKCPIYSSDLKCSPMSNGEVFWICEDESSIEHMYSVEYFAEGRLFSIDIRLCLDRKTEYCFSFWLEKGIHTCQISDVNDLDYDIFRGPFKESPLKDTIISGFLHKDIDWKCIYLGGLFYLLFNF